ncbi:MAG: DUF5320 domain-containing protein [Clostridia bacterium]|nr:DUF5320 domain-containing protein [Clostridia bacterium]
MPRGDRTGPWGMGPRTGRAAGYCSGYPVPGFANPVAGWGFGFGRGLGMGRGRGRGLGLRCAWPGWVWAYPPYPAYGPYSPYAGPYAGPGAVPDTEQEKAFLKDQMQALSRQMKALEKRLGELSEETKGQEEGE